MVLSNLPIGKKAKVKKILVSKDIKRRLSDLGLIENTIIECLFKSPLNDPKAYLVRDSIISLRKKDSSRIEVEFI